MVGMVLFSLAVLQAAAQPTGELPGQLLADRIEVAFRACALQLTQQDYLTAKNKKELHEAGIALSSNVPADVQGMAARLFGANGLYAKVDAPQGEIWLIGSATMPACKVTIANTQLSLSARMLWSNTLRSTAGWSWDKARSGMNGNLMRDLFVLNTQRPGGHMIVILDGPNVIWQDGKGIQMIMTVALETAKAP